MSKFVFPEKYAQTVLDSELTVEALEVNLDENRRRRSSACALTNVTVGVRCRILLNNGFETFIISQKKCRHVKKKLDSLCISQTNKKHKNLCIIY